MSSGMGGTASSSPPCMTRATQKCRQVKDYYLEEICEHEDAGCLGDAENARKWRRAELEELDRQYREGEPLTGCGIALQ